MAVAEVIRCAECAPEEVRAILASGWNGKTKTSDESLDDLLALGKTYKVIDGAGKLVAGYILQVCGAELWIALAVGAAHFDLSVFGMQLIERQARQFDSIGFKTMRRGLVRKLRRIGFEIVDQEGDVFTMRKNLK